MVGAVSVAHRPHRVVAREGPGPWIPASPAYVNPVPPWLRGFAKQLMWSGAIDREVSPAVGGSLVCWIARE